jgi:hypothetical protein
MRNPSPYNLFTDLSPGLFTHVGVITAETGSDGIRRMVVVDLPERGERMPVAVGRSRETAMRTTVSLQSLPDTTLRLLAGASIGLAAGLSLGRVPRLIALAALVPAIFVGSALATRPQTDRKPD